MRKSFTGYYSPTAEQYEHLWNEALFVLDTNVLLNLYRLPNVAREELVAVLQLLQDRLWIPHQVGLEYQRGRLTVIANERKSTEDALSAAQNIVDQVKQKVEGLQIDKRGLGIESKPLLEQLDKSNEQLVKTIKAIHTSQIDISSSDMVRDALDELLSGRVGPGPNTQDELDALVSKGEERFNNKIPPGFADTNKDKNPNDSTFIFDHIQYQRKFGDLILWKQLLNHVQSAQIKTVLFITADRKDDWWWKEHGKTIGPHPELIREIKREGGVEHFWMYSSIQFVEQANKYSKAKISTESVAEIEQVAVSAFSEETPPSLFDVDHIVPLKNFRTYHSYSSESLLKQRKRTIGLWLAEQYGSLGPAPSGYPDFLHLTAEGYHGFTVTRSIKINSPTSQLHLSPKVRRAVASLESGDLNELSLVIVIEQDTLNDLILGDGFTRTKNKLHSMMDRYNLSQIYVGIFNTNDFELLMHERRHENLASDELDDLI